MSTERAEGPRPDAAAAEGEAREPSEDELRAAYEAELSRLTTADVMLQAARLKRAYGCEWRAIDGVWAAA